LPWRKQGTPDGLPVNLPSLELGCEKVIDAELACDRRGDESVGRCDDRAQVVFPEVPLHELHCLRSYQGFYLRLHEFPVPIL
jgi:hypothetical protein